MNNMFSDQRINSGRQVELDLAKCLAIFFMIFLHCFFVTVGFHNTISKPMARIIGQLLGGPLQLLYLCFPWALAWYIQETRNQFIWLNEE